MLSPRGKKLGKLKEREGPQARVARLETMLQQKLIHKYGNKRNPDSRLNILIRKEVKSFIACSGQKPREEAFLELENTVRELRAKHAKGRITSTRDESRTDRSRETPRENKNADKHDQGCPRRADGSGRKREGESTAGGQARSNCDISITAAQDAKPAYYQEEEGGTESSAADGGNHGSGTKMPASMARTWRTFDVAKQIEHEAKEKEKMEKARLDKVRFREELEAYELQKAAEKVQQKEEMRRQIEEQRKRMEDFQKEQEEVKKLQAQRDAEVKILREEQVKRLQAEKEKERRACLESDLRDIERCKAQLQAEIDEQEGKREAERDRLAAIQKENAQQREHRARIQRESDEADAKLLLEHRRRLDGKERKRAERLKERMKRYEDIGNFWNERGAGKAEAEIAKRAEAQMIVEARRKEEAVVERERSAIETKRQARIQMAIDNKKMMRDERLTLGHKAYGGAASGMRGGAGARTSAAVIEEKTALAKIQHQEEMEFSLRFMTDSDAFRQEEREKIVKKRADMERYRRQLEQQVEETRARRLHEEMSETEFQLNSDLLKKLEADKKVVDQVTQRMQKVR